MAPVLQIIRGIITMLNPILEIETNTIAKVRAIKGALTYYDRQELGLVVLETDSLSLKNILTKSCKIPWEIVDIVEEILDIMKSRII